MNINRHNYEAYLLDLLEGRLSVVEQQLLQDFLQLNPDCGGGLTEIEPWILEGEQVSFQNSELIKKELPGPDSILSDHNFDLFSIARMEGDLSQEQLAAHQSMVEGNDRSAQLWEEWLLTRMVPEALSFGGKEKLKHKNGQKSRVLWISIISSAAALAIVFILLRTGSTLPQQKLSVQAPVETSNQQEVFVPDQADMQVEDAVEVEEAVQVEDAVQVEEQLQSSNRLVTVSVKMDYDRPVEEQSSRSVQRDDLQPRPLRIAENRLPASSQAGMPVADQIEPLYVPPVPVHLSSLTVAQISELDLQEMLEDYREEKDISLWKVASAGIKGINKLAGSDISLMASRDEEGEVSGFELKSKRFSVSRPLSREE